MRLLKLILQVALLFAFSLLGSWLAESLHLYIPGNILGLLFLFALLAANVLPLQWVEAGAELLIAELLLFFIPSAIGIIRYRELFQSHFAALLLVIVLSTLAVLISAGCVAEYIGHSRRKRKDAL